jgi:hypothetical protein
MQSRLSRQQKPQRLNKGRKPQGKKLQPSHSFRKLLRLKPILITTFVMIFTAIGIYKLFPSHAEDLNSWCGGSYMRDIPGGGRAYGPPTVAQAYLNGRWTMLVAARGYDNAIWVTSMDSVSLTWKGYWQSLGGITYKTPKITRTVSNNALVTALGTDGNSWGNGSNYSGAWSGWVKLYGTGDYTYRNTIGRTDEYPSKYHYWVQTNYFNGHIQYNCATI